MEIPGFKTLFKLLEENYLRNFPVVLNDARHTLHSYGSDVAALKVNTL